VISYDNPARLSNTQLEGRSVHDLVLGEKQNPGVRNRESLGSLLWIAVAVLAVALIGGYVSSTDFLSTSQAQIWPLPTSTFTPTPPLPTYTPPPPTPTNIPVPHKLPPVCSDAEPSHANLWPPNHKFVEIEVLGARDVGLGSAAFCYVEICPLASSFFRSLVICGIVGIAGRNL
jgi:hypothetical protein